MVSNIILKKEIQIKRAFDATENNDTESKHVY